MYWAPTHGLAFRVDIQVYVYDLGHYDAQAWYGCGTSNQMGVTMSEMNQEMNQSV